jgi:3-oxoacyl-[acyl-carrier protein] reductase
MSTNSNKLAGKVAVVSGASKGIGAAIAKNLAAEGAAVVVNYASSKTGADKVVAEITSAGGKAVAVQGDVAKRADIERLFAETKKLWPARHPGEQCGYLRIFRRQHHGGAFPQTIQSECARRHPVSQAAARLLILAGAASSISARCEHARVSERLGLQRHEGRRGRHHCALATELGPRKIRVNAIRPGMVETEGTHAAGIEESAMQKQVLAQTPLGRLGKPDDIAGTAVFLASADSSWITGETLVIAGGSR